MDDTLRCVYFMARVKSPLFPSMKLYKHVGKSVFACVRLKESKNKKKIPILMIN